jgi:hypothetical protein
VAPPEPIVEQPIATPTPAAEFVAAATWPLRPSLYDLRAAADRVAREDPVAGEELRAYITSLEGYADLDGSLPETFDALIADVFGPALGIS